MPKRHREVTKKVSGHQEVIKKVDGEREVILNVARKSSKKSSAGGKQQIEGRDTTKRFGSSKFLETQSRIVTRQVTEDGTALNHVDIVCLPFL